MKNKKGQQTMGMPFGMIFAIFLIVVFVVIAFMAVRSFLDLGESAGVGIFYEDLQKAVNDAVQGQESSSSFVIDLPGDIEKVCFANLSARITSPGADYEAIRNYDVYNANTFLVPPEKAQNMQWKNIERINITKITAEKNPYCVEVNEGLKIKKGFYDRLVCIGECEGDSVPTSSKTSSGTSSAAPQLSKCQIAERDDTCSLLSYVESEEYIQRCCSDYELCCA